MTASFPSNVFESLTLRGKLLSLSFWRDEEAVKAWRTQEGASCCTAGRAAEIFADYRLRIGHVLRDYGMFERGEVRRIARSWLKRSAQLSSVCAECAETSAHSPSGQQTPPRIYHATIGLRRISRFF